MSDEELDPEVVADLQLRSSSAHDSSRTRGLGVRGYTWTPSEIVAYWPCRGGAGCRGSVAGQPAVVGVTEEALHARETSNRRLRSKMEADIPVHSIVFCEACRAYGTSLSGKANRDRNERMADKIRRLKEHPSDEEQREIIEQLRKWHHPDADGLQQTLREKREASAGKKPRRGY